MRLRQDIAQNHDFALIFLIYVVQLQKLFIYAGTKEILKYLKTRGTFFKSEV